MAQTTKPREKMKKGWKKMNKILINFFFFSFFRNDINFLIFRPANNRRWRKKKVRFSFFYQQKFIFNPKWNSFGILFGIWSCLLILFVYFLAFFFFWFRKRTNYPEENFFAFNLYLIFQYRAVSNCSSRLYNPFFIYIFWFILFLSAWCRVLYFTR